MSAEEEGNEDGDIRLLGIYDALVIDVVDPQGRGRVKIDIPGVVAGVWALQVGGPGGGAARRGFFSTPPVGAVVAAYFNQGDPQAPRYLGGWWPAEADGAADDGGVGTAVPIRARDVPANERHLVHVFETDRWALVFDDRAAPRDDAGEPIDDGGATVGGQDTLLILHKESGQFIEIDGGRRGMTIEATAALFIRSKGLLDLDGLVVQIAGRKVLRTGGLIS